MATCNNCGATVADTAKFCTECGTKIEKKALCVNCGAELREGAKFCVECGTKIATVISEPVNDVKDEFLDIFLENLRNALEWAVEEQLNDYDKMLGGIVEETEEVFDEEEFDKLSKVSVTNCCFWEDNGKEVFEGTLTDGKPHLMLELCLYEEENQNEIDCFIKSSIYKKFIHTKIEDNTFGDYHYFYIDCENNVDEMVDLFKTIIKDVFEMQLTMEWQFSTYLHEGKNKAYKEAIKSANARKLQSIRIQ